MATKNDVLQNIDFQDIIIMQRLTRHVSVIRYFKQLHYYQIKKEEF